MLGVLLAAFLAGAPFAAHAAGSWTYATSAREAQAQQAALHQVPATLLQAARRPGPSGYGSAGRTARGTAPDRRGVTGGQLLGDLPARHRQAARSPGSPAAQIARRSAQLTPVAAARWSEALAWRSWVGVAGLAGRALDAQAGMCTAPAERGRRRSWPDW